ncbi:thioredoxin-like protein [Nitritalea halalkaliphila LW7]|uniref:Thioredoxin-like protein n=1 Tax=Nitritalea halalkaliphila LW7 TaxID=1189621 RepID=I5C1Z5_9BACT|nr:thioredoxin fold domain-containing protein [Nitritalea halalkaliphila]EIM75847.1 thioredoxin-like protein [Nitritalea halalkaliphila LW7]
MRFLYLLALLSFLQLTTIRQTQAQEQIRWMQFEEAVQASAAVPKLVLVDVYTDWCGWCKKMDKETFTDKDVIAFINAHFYPVKLNAESTDRSFEFRGKSYTEASIAKAMRVRSYPNFILMDARMENITQLPGYRKPKDFLESLERLMENFMQGED